MTSTGAVQCPGCGEEKKQLVRHMKTDKKCSIKFEGRIDFESFDKQLKRFRNNRAAQKFVTGEQPMTQMEGYTNLSLIKEEDFNKHGVGHLHAKNSSKRVYQTRR